MLSIFITASQSVPHIFPDSAEEAKCSVSSSTDVLSGLSFPAKQFGFPNGHLRKKYVLKYIVHTQVTSASENIATYVRMSSSQGSFDHESTLNKAHPVLSQFQLQF